MRKLAITHDADKVLKTLQAKQYKQVASTIFRLLDDPLPHDSESLKGAKNGERRVDVGEYRIVYCCLDDMIEVLVIGKRNDDDVYKTWMRMK